MLCIPLLRLVGDGDLRVAMHERASRYDVKENVRVFYPLTPLSAFGSGKINATSLATSAFP